MSKFTASEQRRIQRQILRIERAGLRDAARLVRKLRSRALDRLRSRSTRTIAIRDVTDELTQLVEEAMEASSAIGLKRAEDESPTGPRLELGYLGKTIRTMKALDKMKKSNAVKVLNLRSEYRKLAKKAGLDATNFIAEKLKGAVAGALESGKHLKSGRKALSDVISSLGGASPGGGLLNTLFRTHSQIAYQGTHWAHVEENGLTLWGYTYSTAQDERVRPEHEALDGVTLPKKHPLWKRIAPPNGWNCRCYIIPLYDEEPIVKPKKGWGVDAGFDVNWGRLFAQSS